MAFDDLDKTLDRLPNITIRARARHVVTEIERVRQTMALLRAGRLPDVGPLFDASHASMRDDVEISCPELDVAVEVTRTCPARVLTPSHWGRGHVLVDDNDWPILTPSVQ